MRLFELTSTDRAKILDVVKAFTPATNVYHYEFELETKLSDIGMLLPANWAEKLVQFFFSIYNLNEVNGEQRDIAEELSVSLRELRDLEGKQVDKDELADYRNFLLQIMNAHDSLGLSAKAIRLSFQHDRMFVNAEIFSDIRSIFQKDPSARPEGAVIMHKLKIHTHVSSGARFEDIYTAMEYYDLLQLRDAVERAIKKQQSLERVLDELELKHISLWDDEA